MPDALTTEHETPSLLWLTVLTYTPLGYVSTTEL
jgi:hypothetical protein